MGYLDLWLTPLVLSDYRILEWWSLWYLCYPFHQEGCSAIFSSSAARFGSSNHWTAFTVASSVRCVISKLPSVSFSSTMNGPWAIGTFAKRYVNFECWIGYFPISCWRTQWVKMAPWSTFTNRLKFIQSISSTHFQPTFRSTFQSLHLMWMISWKESLRPSAILF